MGLADRHYEPEYGRKQTFMRSLPPVTKALLILNIVLFVIDVFSARKGDPFGMLTMFGAYAVQSAIFEGRIWEFITFQFLHGGVIHIIFNSIGLFCFGPWMEEYLGSKKFLAFYLLSGIGGAVLYSLLVLVGLRDVGIVGASAGLYGCLVGIAMIAPQARGRVMLLPMEFSMRQIALFFLGFAAVMILIGLIDRNGRWNAAGEAGHLGGALFGFLMMKFPRLLAWSGRPGRDVDIIRPKASRKKSEAKLRPRVDLRKDSEVDLILDKISRDGFGSLTDEEREKLHKASQNQTK